MKFLRSVSGLMFDAQIGRATGACVFVLLFAPIIPFSVNDIARGQCNYIIADVNDNQAATALADVVYVIQYLKGIGLPPPVICDCSPSNPALPAAADIDANCVVNGLDVTRMVHYYMLGPTQFIPCPDCPSDLLKGNNDIMIDGSGSPRVIASDPNAPDEVVLGNLDGSRINVELGQVVDIPLWVMNDEFVAALSISFETDDQYLTPGGGTFLTPLSEWDHHQFRALEANYPVFGRTTQAMLGYCNIPYTNPYLNTNGAPHLQVATLMVTVKPDPANIGDFTVIEFGAGNRLGPTAFCDTLGMEEWNPECQPCTLNIVSSSYGHIGGTVFYDEDGDCVQDPEDTGLPYWEVRANPGNYVTSADQYGNYYLINLPARTYIVSEVVQTNWEQTCPAPPGTYEVDLVGGQTISGKIFGNNGGASPILDLACYIGGGPARPGFYKEYGITCQNNGTMKADATVILTLPPEVTFTSCSPGGDYDNINHTVTWNNISSFPPGWTYWLTAVVLVPSTVPLGRILTSGAQIIPVTGTDINPADNLASESQEVRGSFDPNEKLVSPEGVIERTDMLTYQINFQNVGTDTAFNIVVRDTLDSNLNISTFISGASIHPYTYKITGRVICWTFADINLPDSIVDEPGSHGFVKFDVYPIPTIPAYTIIENRASIFFDFNPPVITNTASNQIAGPPDCIFTPGDANGSGTYNGLDVIYAVSYLKGGSAPIDSCDCPPWPFPLYAAADANGSCTFNGLDVTYGVSYLKMIGPAPLRCPDCPPTELR